MALGASEAYFASNALIMIECNYVPSCAVYGAMKLVKRDMVSEAAGMAMRKEHANLFGVSKLAAFV